MAGQQARQTRGGLRMVRLNTACGHELVSGVFAEQQHGKRIDTKRDIRLAGAALNAVRR